MFARSVRVPANRPVCRDIYLPGWSERQPAIADAQSPLQSANSASSPRMPARTRPETPGIVLSARACMLHLNGGQSPAQYSGQVWHPGALRTSLLPGSGHLSEMLDCAELRLQGWKSVPADLPAFERALSPAGST